MSAFVIYIVVMLTLSMYSHVVSPSRFLYARMVLWLTLPLWFVVYYLLSAGQFRKIKYPVYENLFRS